MFLVNYLNRTFTDNFFPLFECIYAIELAIQFVSIILSIPVICAIWKTNYFHRNIRLRLILLVLNAIFASIARIVIIAHQIFGPTQHVEVWHLIVASIFREYFKVYITGLAFVLSIDRWIATISWSWYESRAPSTILVMIAQEIGECSIAFTSASLLINELITDQEIMLIYLVQLAIGTLCYHIILRYNKKEIDTLRKGAKIESYSVARSFQLHENLTIMMMLSKVALPAVLFTTPCFILYGIYSRFPVNQGLDTIRYLSIALYDAWISVSFLTIVINLIRFETKFRYSFLTLPFIVRFRNKVGTLHVIERTQKATVHETNLYFTMLANDWESGTRPSQTLRNTSLSSKIH